MSWKLENIDQGDFAQELLDLRTTWLLGLAGCPQDPIHHAEGDVLTHVLMVCQELVKLPKFQALSSDEKQTLAWAALLHDIAKPVCNIREPDGRISSPGHARKGAIQARQILWDLDCPFKIREQICGLIHYHMKVFWVLDQDDPDRLIRRISLSCRCDLLAILAEADARGRRCEDLQDLLDRIELFRQLADESQCLDQQAEFASDLSRFQYFEGKWHNPESAPFEKYKCRVILMSGLPGAGKDTWIQKKGPHWPVVSLDVIREAMGISPTGNQGRVIDEAREQARKMLRMGRNFVWNATNLSKRLRSKSLSLFLDYGAHVTIVYVEPDIKTLEIQNQEREDAVPWKAIESMLTKWEIPEATEAHRIKFVVS